MDEIQASFANLPYQDSIIYQELSQYWNNEGKVKDDIINDELILQKLLEKNKALVFVTNLNSAKIVYSKGALPSDFRINNNNLIGDFHQFFDIIQPPARSLALRKIKRQYDWLNSLNDEQKKLSHISQTFYALFEGTTPQYIICKSFVLKLAPDGSIAQRLHYWSESSTLSNDIKNTILYLHAPGVAAQLYTYENNDPETEKTITRAEQSVWHALVKYDSVDKVAEALFVSRNTIESHRK